MKKFHSFITLLMGILSIADQVWAQENKCSMCGIYHLEGENEVATGFNLRADSSFEFYFSYGALDRYGNGRWSTGKNVNSKNQLLLNSVTKKGPAMHVISKTTNKAENTHIALIGTNEALYPYFFAQGFSSKDSSFAECDKEGVFDLKLNAYDSIRVVFEWCPDHTLLLSSTKEYNNFEIQIEEWMFETEFTNFPLQYENKQLSGKHPFRPGTFLYTKQEE